MNNFENLITIDAGNQITRKWREIKDYTQIQIQWDRISKDRPKTLTWLSPFKVWNKNVINTSEI